MFKRQALGQLRGDVLAGTFYVSNWYQIFTGLGYTASGDFAPLRHLWSLAVEEQFYLIWPIMMVVLLGRSGTRRVADVSRWLFVAAVAITVPSRSLYYTGPIAEPSITPDAYWWIGGRPIGKIDTLYLSTFTRLGGLLLGSAFAWCGGRGGGARSAAHQGPMVRRRRAARIVLHRLDVLDDTCWPPSTAPTRSCSAAACSSPGSGDARDHRRRHPPWRVRRTGSSGTRCSCGSALRSYGLYLYHWPIFR